MKFTTDKQTLDDLGLLGKFKSNSIYSLFNRVRTAGGERLLNTMFHEPLSNENDINQRSAGFRYFQQCGVTFPFTAAGFIQVENYLSNGTGSNLLSVVAGITRKKITGTFLRDPQYAVLNAEILAVIKALNVLKNLVAKLDNKIVESAKRILSDKRLTAFPEIETETISLFAMARYDYLLRHTMRREMDELLNVIYELDVYMAVGKVAQEKNFSYAMALPSSRNIFETTGLHHPGLIKAVSNPVLLTGSQNLMFLTGANMAGKSTLMKSIGIATYLAHMGFPVAATDMRFSVRDGLFTSINVPDNLEMGFSHFYAEVLRVKKVAEEVSSGKKLLIIFDELFKGTNVKDAYDATLAVTRAFSKYSACSFVISTHIIEVGEALQKEIDSIKLCYLPTIIKGNVPTYPYTLREGITGDRQGMIIINNEKIIELLYS